MTDFVIETAALRRSFAQHTALDGLNLYVPQGSIFGFLGRNGAGKTTTIRILMSLIRPDGGEARVLGEPVAGPGTGVALRRRIGFVSEDKELYPYFTVEQMTRSRCISWDATSARSGSSEQPLQPSVSALYRAISPVRTARR